MPRAKVVINNEEEPKKLKKLKHKSLQVKYNDDGKPVALCPSCDRWILIRVWHNHGCTNPIVKREE